MLGGSRAFSGKIHQLFLAHVVRPLAARISWRWLVAKVGTFENKKVRKHLHLWPLGPHKRRLAVRSGTSKGITISQYGCSTFGALATEAQKKEEEKLTFVSSFLLSLFHISALLPYFLLIFPSFLPPIPLLSFCVYLRLPAIWQNGTRTCISPLTNSVYVKGCLLKSTYAMWCSAGCKRLWRKCIDSSGRY